MNVHTGKSGKRIPVTDATKERWQWSPRMPLWQRMLQRLSQWFGGSVEGRTLQRVPIAARQRSVRRLGK
jgi:hypothetical protein